ncbi:MAG: ribosome maturation factor RimM [Spirochaetales bacterium]|nr:ribosome maturation factor RimM [Spirochaetales bacterium]
MSGTQNICIGAVRTAWGVRGWVKLISFSGEWQHFSDLETVSLRPRKGGVAREYQVEGFRLHHGGGLLKFAGIESPEAAKTLSGCEILVSKEQGAPLQDDEWYLSDLVGLQMIASDGQIFGTVVGVVESADDLLEVERSSGSRFLVPFRKEFVGEPDLENGTVELTAPQLAEEA